MSYEEESYDIEFKCIKIQACFRSYRTRYKIVTDIIKGSDSNDWNKLINLYNILGESLNKNDMKPMKGKLYELFITQKSKFFKHVDQLGYDIISFGIKIEIKFSQNMLLQDKKRELKKKITFRFKNSNGSGNINLTNENTANIYVLIQRDAVGYVNGYNVKKYLKSPNGGDIDAKIPRDYINIIWKADSKITITNGEFNLSEIITEIYKCICNSVWMGLDWKIQLKQCLYKIADDL
jgi:hypothetical protein